MKILFILENHYPNIGGVETLFKSLTESLVTDGYKITVLTNQFDKQLKRNEILNGVEIIRVPFANRYMFTLFAVFPALSLARKHDLIHTTSYNAGIPAFLAGLFSRKKVLITFHEVWGKMWMILPFMNKFSLYLHYLFEQLLLKLPFHKFIAVSIATQKNLIANGVSSSKIQLIHNGINYDAFEGKQGKTKSSCKFVFTYFGRLGISKGLDILLTGVELLSKESNDFELKLIIPTEPAGFHKMIVDTIGEKKIDSFIKIKSDLSKLTLLEEVRQSDAVVIPSYSEGFCFTAVETMALNIPIISSGKAALAEVVSGEFLTMKTHDAAGLKEVMKEAIAGNWDQSEKQLFKLEDTIAKYQSMYSTFDK